MCRRQVSPQLCASDGGGQDCPPKTQPHQARLGRWLALSGPHLDTEPRGASPNLERQARLPWLPPGSASHLLRTHPVRDWQLQNIASPSRSSSALYVQSTHRTLESSAPLPTLGEALHVPGDPSSSAFAISPGWGEPSSHFGGCRAPLVPK